MLRNITLMPKPDGSYVLYLPISLSQFPNPIPLNYKQISL